MVHGITFVNVFTLAMIVLLIAPELIRRYQHAIDSLTIIGVAPAFKPKRGHLFLRGVTGLMVAGLVAYDSVILVAWFANH